MTDVQLNNSQMRHMEKFDNVYAHEFAAEEDVRFFVNRFYSHFTNRGVFDFLFDIFITTHVMKKREISHEQYKKLQLDIDHLFNLVRRTGNLAQRTKRVLENQSRIMNLMNLPNFQNESETHQEIFTFNEIRVQDVKFSYATASLEDEEEKKIEVEPPVLALDIEGEIKFESGKTYAIIGQNRSGKSTLVHLLCKLYSPHSGNIYFDEYE
jgi:ABC-type multidrug transport system fused ATPase/permease subunit